MTGMEVRFITLLCDKPFYPFRRRYRSKIIVHLEIHPEFRTSAKGLRQEPSRFWRHPPLTPDKLVYSLDRHTKVPSQFCLR